MTARAAAANREAAKAGAEIYRESIPKGSGQTAGSVRGTTRAIDGGFAGRVGPSNKREWLLRFPDKGTGLMGPKGQLIHPRKARMMRTPFGPRVSIKGQRAQNFLAETVERVNAVVMLTLSRAAERGM